MAEHAKLSPDSSPSRAPSLDKSRTASRKVSPTETPLPSPPDSLQRARPAAVALPQVLIEALHERDFGHRDEDYHKTFPLSWEEFKIAREKIEETFRRFDYDPFKGEITIRMPTTIHECFASSVNSAVIKELWPLKNGDTATANFVKDIRPILSSDIYMDNPRRTADLDDDVDKKKQKSPDLQFSHIASKHPGVVIEKAALTLDQDGNQHILKADQILKEVPFRSANREPLNEGRELRIFCLHDMTTDESLLEGVDNLSISLPFKDLCDFLTKAENMQCLRRTEKKRLVGGRPIKFMPPSSSPEEELASEDERAFAELEEAEQKRASDDDRSFSSPVGEDIDAAQVSRPARLQSDARPPTLARTSLSQSAAEEEGKAWNRVLKDATGSGYDDVLCGSSGSRYLGDVRHVSIDL
ncbi:hypothetical protein FPCIR_11839 [Fusarium pseudocircinatum]|uniref:Uncharacterized protein n=1 Tax=Fusarium pseudocircinatum TaxID=56676 RepID=A0A8H5KQ57_9HYPO|nr:hypothetical protein FPCIR_11839 [Fusarium pseudocircinatum]